MVKGLQRSISRAPANRASVQTRVLTFNELAIEIDGASGVGFGSVVVGDFPEGNINFMGATAYVQIAGPGAAGLSDTWAGDYGVGTTPAGDATISGTDVDIIASTALAAATAEVSPRTRGTNATGAIFDNTDNSLEVNLNVLVDDADISADDLACTATGEVTLAYIVMGDD